VAGATGAFVDKNAANGKTVNITEISLGGTDVGNYNLTNNTAATTANITPAPISAVTGITASDKIYNGNADATLITGGAGFTGIFTGDTLTVATATGVFVNAKNEPDKNVAIDTATGIIAPKSVSITGISLGGTDAKNYNLTTTTATTSAKITPLDNATWTGNSSPSNSNWSDKTNWKDEVIPDMANVVKVTIPADATVVFNSSVSTIPADNPADNSVQIGCLDGGGNLTVQDGILKINKNLAVGNPLAGTMTTAGYNQTGGKLYVDNKLTINSANAVQLGNMDVGSLNVTVAGANNLTQVKDAKLTIGGASSLTANNIGSADVPLTLNAPLNSVTINTTATGTITGWLAGTTPWPGAAWPKSMMDSFVLIKYNNKVVGAGEAYSLYQQAQRTGVSAATVANSAQMVDKMMKLSSFTGFFDVAPEESLIVELPEPPEATPQQFLQGVTPDGSSCIMYEKK